MVEHPNSMSTQPLHRPFVICVEVVHKYEKKNIYFQDLDSYLKNRSPVSFLSELRDNLLLANSNPAAAAAASASGEQPGNRYNIQVGI